MSRRRRIIVPGPPHHITQRGDDRSAVYRDNEDRELYLELLGKFTQQFEVELFAYCLMTTHLHFGLAIRYVELNPVRAGMVQRAEAYSWSSTRGCCGLRVDPLIAPLGCFQSML